MANFNALFAPRLISLLFAYSLYKRVATSALPIFMSAISAFELDGVFRCR